MTPMKSVFTFFFLAVLPIFQASSSIIHAPLSYIAVAALSLFANREIVPGSRIGDVHLKAFSSSLEKTIGKPDKGDAAMGLAWESWKVDGGTLSVVVRRTEEGHDYVVRDIRVTAKTFKTDKGIDIGSKFDQIHKNFPSLTALGTFKLPNSKRATLYDANKEGIAFEISEGICVGIVVHESGKLLTSAPEERLDWKGLTAKP